MPNLRTTRVSFSVPGTFKVPDWYSVANPQEIADALVTGANLYETMRTIKSTTEVQALEAQKAAEMAILKEHHAVQLAAHQAELDKTLAEKTSAAQRMQELLESQRVSLTKHAAEQIATLQAELDKAQAEKTASSQRMQELLESQRIAMESAAAKDKERLATQHTQRLSEVQSELMLQQERYAALLERRQQLESGRDADIRLAEERTKVLLQHALDEKEKAILRSEKMFQTLRDSYERQSEELKALSDLLRKKPSASAKTKGNDYEEEFRAKLVATFGVGEGFALSDTSKGVGHAGDSVMKWGEHYVLWEVKNYDKPVPGTEVDKFKRDMRENAQVRIGVMISRCTSIVGKNTSGDRDIEFIDGKMLLYFSNFESMSDDTLPNLLTLFRLWWKIDQTTATSVEDESKEQTIRQINKLHQDACRAKNEWRVHKSRMEEALRWMATQVDETESRLKSALNIIQGCVVSNVALPETIFRDVHGDPVLMKDAQTILKFAVAEEGKSLVLNDLAELFSKERALSREAAKSHIRAVLLDKVLETPKGRSTRVLGLVIKTEEAPALGGAGTD